jgi:hypothetical protein
MTAELAWGGNLPHGCTDADVDRAASQVDACDDCEERAAEIDGLCEGCAIDEAVEILRTALDELDRAKRLASCRGRSDIGSAHYHAWLALLAEEGVQRDIAAERGAA